MTVGTDAQARMILAGAESTEERAIWTWLLEQAQPYPAVKYQPPTRPPRRVDRPRLITVAHADIEREGEGAVPVLRALEIADETSTSRYEYVSGGDHAQCLAELLFTDARRRHLIVVPHGATVGFHLMLRTYGREWLRLGYTIQPLGTGNSIKALIVRLGKSSWTLADHATVTGLGTLPDDEFLTAFAGGWLARLPRAQAWYHALTRFAKHLSRTFGTAAQVTIGRTALRAAMRHLPEDRWLWRTPPLEVALARAGGGFRGGYAVASRFSGDAYRADMTKAYTWALGQPLPHRSAFTRPQGPLWTREGMYLCRVTGRGLAPAYLSVWRGASKGFERIYHEGGDVWSILPSAEFHGLARLGFSVRPVAGFATVATFTLAGFLEQLQGILDTHARTHPLALMCKALGNNVYGKLAESPQRTNIMYAMGHPGEGWQPYTDNEGIEQVDLWEQRTSAHRAHHRIDIAATITARVRGRLYEAIADVHEAGYRVVHADTDGLLSTGPLVLGESERSTLIGAWRADSEPLPTFVWGRKAYAYGDDVRVAGAWGVSAVDAALLAQGGTLAIEQTMMAVPWRGTAIFEPLTRTLRATVA